MHVMIDIETLSTHPTAAFFEVAAVPFDLDRKEPHAGDLHSNPGSLHLHIDPSNQIESGKFHVDWNTIKWWKNQTQSWDVPERIPTLMALQKLINTFNWKEVEGIWSKGSCFDIPILDHAFRAYGLKTPWSYRSVWDVRTIEMLARTTKTTNPSHNALEDALSQINDVQAARRILVGEE